MKFYEKIIPAFKVRFFDNGRSTSLVLEGKERSYLKARALRSQSVVDGAAGTFKVAEGFPAQKDQIKNGLV